MQEVAIYTLCSGSSGNCTYIRCGNTSILIDAGASRRAIMKALADIGATLASLDAIFVTHEHSDHIKGLPMLAKHDGIPIYVSPASLSALTAVSRHLIRPLEHPAGVTLGDMTVESFLTPHDSLSSCGYIVSYKNHRFGYATDIGHPTPEVADALLGCDAVILEANYDETMLKYGPYPLFLKERIRSDHGHLDNEVSAKICAYLAKSGTKRVLLAHLSAENNTPNKALAAVQKALCKEKVSLSLAVADRYCPTELITIPSC